MSPWFDRRPGKEEAPTLLTLSAEMRNPIYRYTLIEDQAVIMSVAHLPVEPGLLQHLSSRAELTTHKTKICLEIRQDALAIYYQENKLGFRILDFDADAYIKYCKSAQRRCNSNYMLVIWHPQAGLWPNLLRWLEAYWREETEALEPAEENDFDSTKACAHLFGFVINFRIKKRNASWKDVTRLLGGTRGVLEASDTTWL
ncbi:hypothetical protein DOTSEDRAFT_35045 [Dothistroma septosporum NZE10]|uniref:Uncharacterized protein n=1 Tax=Dothistroma septosporum (strain NZE10 / CBS 128990) TaxID=675120 RepID=N1PMK8_DOTSN|nr:hypothetical protein DOTSEDRAFT_35045 [Dothistroma septosporum NZE10]